MARGAGVMVGPLLGVLCLGLGACAGCLVNLVQAMADRDAPWFYWQDFGAPLVRSLLIGLLPALCVGGVFSVMHRSRGGASQEPLPK